MKAIICGNTGLLPIGTNGKELETVLSISFLPVPYMEKNAKEEEIAALIDKMILKTCTGYCAVEIIR
jgi:hypothetical protein